MPDDSDAVGYGHKGQIDAVIERIVPDGGDTTGDSDGSQGGASKRTVPDSGDAVSNGDRG